MVLWQGQQAEVLAEAEVLAHGPKQGHVADRLLTRFNLGRAWREMEVLWLGQEAMPQACAGSGAREAAQLHTSGGSRSFLR